jgi:uncharacterized damage-inducible protein DinB
VSEPAAWHRALPAYSYEDVEATMSVGISLEEMLAWNDEAAGSWKAHLDAHPEALKVTCDIGGAANMQELVRHIWGVELRWGQRLAGLPVTPKEAAPAGPLDVLFGLHRDAMEIFRNLLSAPEQSWNETFAVDLSTVPEEMRLPTRRKLAAHALIHSQRHYAQLATLLRQSGFPATARGDLLFSPALR